MSEGDAALAIDQQSIERGADPSGYGRCPLRVGIDGVAARIMAAALEPGPVEVPLDAEHQRIDLPIDADLPAADEAGLVESVVPTGEGIAPRRMRKTRAEIAADIEAGPMVDRWRIGDRRNWRRRAARRYIGGLRRTNANNCAGGERNAADKFTRIHARSPAQRKVPGDEFSPSTIRNRCRFPSS